MGVMGVSMIQVIASEAFGSADALSRPEAAEP